MRGELMGSAVSRASWILVSMEMYPWKPMPHGKIDVKFYFQLYLAEDCQGNQGMHLL